MWIVFASGPKLCCSEVTVTCYTALWQSFSAKSINRLRSCYNKCMKHFWLLSALQCSQYAI